MAVFENLAQISPSLRGSVIAIGNFDGVHHGHRLLLAEGRRIAAEKKVSFGVLTFEPHPRKLFRPDDPPFRITPPEMKYRLLEQSGADFVISLPFDWDFASQSAEDFVQGIVLAKLAPAHILLGEDFRFGQLRKGSAATLRDAALAVTTVAPFLDDRGKPYSSTAVREALRHGDIAQANGVLGWNWEITGMVFRGDRRGHELGYPTANILLGDVLHPAYGIYSSLVLIEGEDAWLPAATNIGIRPMFELKQGQVEAHILDFPDRDIYGKTLRVRPVERLRGEAKFSSLGTLIAQIETDCGQVRRSLMASA